MDQEKYDSRIIELTKESLSYQNLSKKIIPIKLIDNQDRYFIIQCKINAKKVDCVFIRYDKWLFYLYGLKKIPNIGTKRKYVNNIRSKRIDMTKLIEKKREKFKLQIKILRKEVNDMEKNL